MSYLTFVQHYLTTRYRYRTDTVFHVLATGHECGREGFKGIRAMVGQHESLPKILLQNCTKWFRWSPTESARNCWSCRDVIWKGISHFKWGIGNEKLSGWCLPKLLTQDQKRIRVEMSEEYLTRFQKNQQNFCTSLWPQMKHGALLYPRDKTQWKQWKHVDSPPPKKAKEIRSAGKIMASVLWDAKGILLIDYLTTGQIIMEQYYSWTTTGRIICAQKASFSKKESLVPSGQCAPAHMCHCHGNNAWTEIQNSATPTLFAWYGSIRLPSLP